MLDNLRAMAVFASVVRHGSFSGAAKELNITTSAVSQQIRSLEIGLGVLLLHRSTRKLSLTEAGACLYEAAKNMVKAAEEGRNSISQMRDNVQGTLKIATTPILACQYIFPALSPWIKENSDLSLQIITNHGNVDMIDERVDLSVYFASNSKDTGTLLYQSKQLLLASGNYLAQNTPIHTLQDLNAHHIIDKEAQELVALSKEGDRQSVRPNIRLLTNDTALALQLASDGYGIIKVSDLEAKSYLQNQALMPILPDYEFNQIALYAHAQSKEQQPAKVRRALNVLTDYFKNMRMD